MATLSMRGRGRSSGFLYSGVLSWIQSSRVSLRISPSMGSVARIGSLFSGFQLVHLNIYLSIVEKSCSIESQWSL